MFLAGGSAHIEAFYRHALIGTLLRLCEKGQSPMGPRLGGPRCPYSPFILPLFLRSALSAYSREKAKLPAC
jgi:hypothetical protein